MPNEGHPTYRCDNCGRVYDPDEGIGERITEKNWHMEPGSIVPHGACNCGGYIYAIDGSPRGSSSATWGQAAEEREIFEEAEEQMRKEITNYMIQSEFAARAFDALMNTFSEKQRREFAATGCITIYVQPGLPMKKVPYGHFEMFKKNDSPNLQEFVSNFKVTKEQLEAAAKEKPLLMELLEKQVSEQALEEFINHMMHEINMQRRYWKESPFGEK